MSLNKVDLPRKLSRWAWFKYLKKSSFNLKEIGDQDIIRKDKIYMEYIMNRETTTST